MSEVHCCHLWSPLLSCLKSIVVISGVHCCHLWSPLLSSLESIVVISGVHCCHLWSPLLSCLLSLSSVIGPSLVINIKHFNAWERQLTFISESKGVLVKFDAHTLMHRMV